MLISDYYSALFIYFIFCIQSIVGKSGHLRFHSCIRQRVAHYLRMLYNFDIQTVLHILKRQLVLCATYYFVQGIKITIIIACLFWRVYNNYLYLFFDIQVIFFVSMV
jgi:hypothetical protein